jgi:hypothetical protein
MATPSYTFTPTGGKSITIYGEAANINYFLNTPLVSDIISGVTNHDSHVDGFTRRQYPGDTSTASVASHTRYYMKDKTRRSGSALPGKSFVLNEIKVGDDGERRAFTFKGRVMDLHKFLIGQAKKNMFLHLNTGAKYKIAQVTTTP